VTQNIFPSLFHEASCEQSDTDWRLREAGYFTVRPVQAATILLTAGRYSRSRKSASAPVVSAPCTAEPRRRRGHHELISDSTPTFICATLKSSGIRDTALHAIEGSTASVPLRFKRDRPAANAPSVVRAFRGPDTRASARGRKAGRISSSFLDAGTADAQVSARWERTSP